MRDTRTGWQDAVTLITGASFGIGEHLARQAAARGGKLVLAARRRPELEAVREACLAAGGEALCVPTDVGDETQCKQLVDAALGAYGRIDVLVNNAGLGMWSRADAVTDFSVFERVMRVNYLGAVFCTMHALPHLKATRGRLVCVSSLAGRAGAPLRSGYAASKHALAGFFDSLRIELADTGVSVTMAYPGFVSTGAHKRNLGADGTPYGSDPVDLASMMPPAQCARVILDAAARRRREVVFPAYGKIALLLKAFAPGMVDRLSAKMIQRMT